jgi:hypothetical protein
VVNILVLCFSSLKILAVKQKIGVYQLPGGKCSATIQCAYNSTCNYTSLTCQCVNGYYLSNSSYCGKLCGFFSRNLRKYNL